MDFLGCMIINKLKDAIFKIKRYLLEKSSDNQLNTFLSKHNNCQQIGLDSSAKIWINDIIPFSDGTMRLRIGTISRTLEYNAEYKIKNCRFLGSEVQGKMVAWERLGCSRGYKLLISFVVPLFPDNYTLQCDDYSKSFFIKRSEVKALIEKFHKLHNIAFSDPIYTPWFNSIKANKEDLKVQSLCKFEHDILISLIVPLWNTEPVFFTELISSIKTQSCDNWELILVNASPDNKNLCELIEQEKKGYPKIHVVEVTENKGIVGNTLAGIKKCHGTHIAFIDHDDVVEPNLIFEYCKAIDDNYDAGLFYCDEDKLFEDGHYGYPELKSQYSIDRMRCANFVCHMLCCKKDILMEVGYPDKSFEGSQDYSLTLRIVDAGYRAIHIPKMLYHWRICPTSVLGNTDTKPYAHDAGTKAIEENCNRLGDTAIIKDVSFGIRSLVYKPKIDKNVLVLIVCDHENADIDIIKKSIGEKYLSFCDISRVFIGNQLFKEINQKIRETKCEYICLIRENVVFKDNAFENLLGCAQRKGVSISVPVFLHCDGVMAHSQGVLSKYTYGYYQVNTQFSICPTICLDDNSSIADFGCMIFSKETFEEVNGFDESYTGICGSIDFSIRVREMAYSQLDHLIAFNANSQVITYDWPVNDVIRIDSLDKFIDDDEKRLYYKNIKYFEKGDIYISPYIDKIKLNSRFDYSIINQ